MKILILGGYGTFGGRLAHLLADDERLTLLIAGRSKRKALEFCSSQIFRAQTVALAFDRDVDVEHQIRELRPNLVVDATGPFQLYGDNPYRVVNACLACRVNYVDLADGSDFVKGITQFDAEAKAKNIFILSGVSSFPVLTAAVVRHLSGDISHLNSITAGIAPSPYAGVGLNVLRAIAAYAGQPIAIRRDGGFNQGYALTESIRYRISPPNYRALPNIRFSLVDVPDLQVLPELWPDVKSVWIGAGPVPEILHRMLNGLAWLVRLKLIKSLLPLAKLFYYVMKVVRWGDHRGGMFVSVEGISADGKPIARSWHLLAEGNDGPLIPSMAIEIIVRKLLLGVSPVAGAKSAAQELTLSDYEEVFKKRTIYMGQKQTAE